LAQPPVQHQYHGLPAEGEFGSIGAFINPHAIPAEAHSAKLKHLMESFSSLAAILRHRARSSSQSIAYSCVDTKGKEIGSWTWSGLHTRALQIVALLRHKGVCAPGSRVALVYRKYEMLDFVGSLFGCFYAGMCAVPVVAGDSYAELAHVLNSTGAALVLTTELNTRALNKDLAQNNVGPGWPSAVAWVRTDQLGGHVLSAVGAGNVSAQHVARPATAADHGDESIDRLTSGDVAYIEFSKSPNGELKGVQVTHGEIMQQSAVWMMSTGMLDIGRKYKHRVELQQDSGETTDYALALDDESQSRSQSRSQSQSQSQSPSHGRSPQLPMLSVSHTDPLDLLDQPMPSPTQSSKHRWGSGGGGGFLDRLRSAGSLPRIRRGSRARDSASIVSSEGAGRDADAISMRTRAASNLSTLGREIISAPRPLQALPPAAQAEATPPQDAASVAVFEDVVVTYVEPRQHLGLVYGVLGGCYGGHQTVYASSAVCDTAGAYINVLTRYCATVAAGDYTGLQAVLSAATDEPASIGAFSKKTAPNLGRLRLLLVDTLFIDGAFHAAFNRSVLHPFGCPYRAIEDTEGHAV
ncbi:hypothetical protein LPJ66_011502, partial [Kickxella alabastrina]